MRLFNINFPKKNNKLLNKKNKIDQYDEIGKLLKEARIQNNLSIKALSDISRIPESTINAIENNIKDHRPEYPFIRSILLKLEKCVFLQKNTLLKLAKRETNILKTGNQNFIIRKFDFINSWQGIITYFLFLILVLFLLNRYFISNIKIIEIQIIEQKVNLK